MSAAGRMRLSSWAEASVHTLVGLATGRGVASTSIAGWLATSSASPCGLPDAEHPSATRPRRCDAHRCHLPPPARPWPRARSRSPCDRLRAQRLIRPHRRWTSNLLDPTQAYCIKPRAGAALRPYSRLGDTPAEPADALHERAPERVRGPAQPALSRRHRPHHRQTPHAPPGPGARWIAGAAAGMSYGRLVGSVVSVGYVSAPVASTNTAWCSTTSRSLMWTRW